MSEIQFAQTVSAEEEWEIYNRIEDALYCLWQTADSSVSIETMKLVCWKAGVPFPPQKQDMGLQPPVSAEFN